MMMMNCATSLMIIPIIQTLTIEGRIFGRNNHTAKLGVARALRVINDSCLLRATDLVRVYRSGRCIGCAVFKPAVSGDTGSVQGLDVRSQRRNAGANRRAVVPIRSGVPGRFRVG
jgi:hypothetical protein